MDKYIYRAEKILSTKQCVSLINFFNSEKIKKKQGPKNKFCRLTNTFYYEYISINTESPMFNNELRECIDFYSSLHTFLKNPGVPKWDIFPKCNMQKYLPKRHYIGEHCEHSNNNINSQRILAWMFYLNDIKGGGGGTSFPQQNLTIEANQGDLYIWPAAWTHSHMGIPAVSEEKYILTGWCNYLADEEVKN